MKTISTWTSVALGALMILNGCQTPQGMSKLTVTDNQEKDYKWPKPRNHFEIGETPVIRVIGCDGENIILQIVDISSGKTARATNNFIPKPAVHVEPERIKMGTIANNWDGQVVPIRYKQIDVYKSQFFWSPNQLPAGTYEVRLIVEGKLAETFPFNISN